MHLSLRVKRRHGDGRGHRAHWGRGRTSQCERGRARLELNRVLASLWTAFGLKLVHNSCGPKTSNECNKHQTENETIDLARALWDGVQGSGI
eukprot:343195-Pyramimonas_sp.AAC.1